MPKPKPISKKQRKANAQAKNASRKVFHGRRTEENYNTGRPHYAC